MLKNKIYILLALLIATMAIGEVSANQSKTKRKHRVKTHKVIKKKKKVSRKRTAVVKPIDPRLNDPDYDPFLSCEDTCGHIHGIDLSHYQGQVFWETVGENTKMAYVYLKATEGGDRIDERYERNIELAHRY